MRSAVVALALGLTLAAAGVSSCAGPGDPVQPPEPGPEVTPVYGSEEEALAAAEELYGRYLEISNAIGQAGWEDTEALREVVRDRALEDDLKSAEEYRSKGWTQVGASTFDSVDFQQLDDGGEGAIVMVVYLCVDVSGVDVVDESGKSIVSSDRPKRQPLEVELDDVDGHLKISRSEVWTGQDLC